MLSIQRVSRMFEGEAVLRDVTLEIARGEILCLLGASGSGKTTLLRMVAGLEPVDTGDILLEGQSIVQVPVHTRNFGLMFQDFALFPHLSVEGNIAFGLNMQHRPTEEARERVLEMLRLVDLDGFAHRDVSSLSGGERQRVALARSLAPKPRLLMLDEPLGSLDAALREQLARELRGIIRSIGQTAIYVTHDHHEAFAVADRVALLHNGRIEQVSPPEQLYHQPASAYTAEFLGLENLFTLQDWSEGQFGAHIGDLSLDADADVILIHPNGITLTHEKTGVEGVITRLEFEGSAYQVRVRSKGDIDITFRVAARDGRNLRVGQVVDLNIDPTYVMGLKQKPPSGLEGGS